MADTGMAIQRASDKTEELQARASAIEELTATGALEDFSDNRTQLDRELAQISATSQVDDELAKLKAEVGCRRRQAKEIEPGHVDVVVGLGDVLFGRKKLKEPARDRLFALTTAAVTLDVECGLKPAGVGARRLQAAVGRRVRAGRPGRRAAAAERRGRRRARRSTARRTRSASSGSSSATPSSRTR